MPTSSCARSAAIYTAAALCFLLASSADRAFAQTSPAKKPVHSAAQSRTRTKKAVASPPKLPDPTYGMEITSIEDASLENQGLQKGDIITHVDGQLIPVFLLPTYLNLKYPPNSTVTFTVRRNDLVLPLKITLGASPFGGAQFSAGGKLHSLLQTAPQEDPAWPAAPFVPGPGNVVYTQNGSSLTLRNFPVVPEMPGDATSSMRSNLRRMKELSALFHQFTSGEWKPQTVHVLTKDKDIRAHKDNLFCNKQSGPGLLTMDAAVARSYGLPQFIAVSDVSHCNGPVDGLMVYPDSRWTVGQLQLTKNNAIPAITSDAAQWWNKEDGFFLLQPKPRAPSVSIGAVSQCVMDGKTVMLLATDQNNGVDCNAGDFETANMGPGLLKGTLASNRSLKHWKFTTSDGTLTAERDDTHGGALVTTTKAFNTYGPPGTYHVGSFNSEAVLSTGPIQPTQETLNANQAMMANCPHPTPPTGWALWAPNCSTTPPWRYTALSPDQRYTIYYYEGLMQIHFEAPGASAVDWFTLAVDAQGQPQGRTSIQSESLPGASRFVGIFHGLTPDGDGYCRVKDNAVEACSYQNGNRVDQTYLARLEAERRAAEAAERQRIEQERQEAENQRQRKIKDLQDDILFQQNTMIPMAQSCASGLTPCDGGLSCMVYNLALAKCQKDENTARNKIDEDTEEIQRLNGEEVQAHERRDSSYLGNLNQVNDSHPINQQNPNSIEAAKNQALQNIQNTYNQTHSQPQQTTSAFTFKPAQVTTPTVQQTTYSAANNSAPAAAPVKPRAPKGQGCVNINHLVSLNSKWDESLGHCDKGVVGWLENHSTGYANCSWAFNRPGGYGDAGAGTLKPGERTGGEMQGIWSCGEVTADMKYVCYAAPGPGADAVDDNGDWCLANVNWNQ